MNTPHDMPAITQAHLQAAFALLCIKGETFDTAMQDPIRARIVHACASTLRAKEYTRTHARTVVPVRRIKLDVDGHPIGWCTQLVRGHFDPQPDLIGS